MKLRALAAAVAALALAGVASAQDGGNPQATHPFSHYRPYLDPRTLAGVASAQDVGNLRAAYPFSRYSPYLDPRALATYRDQVKIYKMACAVDRQVRCVGRHSSGAVWNCLKVRRSTLSEPCRGATYAVERAAADASLIID